MIHIGETARRLREKHGLMQKEAANLLGISAVHLCNVENNKVMPTPALIEKYRGIWGVDIYVLAWCELGQTSDLPVKIRDAASKLGKLWFELLESPREGKKK